MIKATEIQIHTILDWMYQVACYGNPTPPRTNLQAAFYKKGNLAWVQFKETVVIDGYGFEFKELTYGFERDNDTSISYENIKALLTL